MVARMHYCVAPLDRRVAMFGGLVASNLHPRARDRPRRARSAFHTGGTTPAHTQRRQLTLGVHFCTGRPRLSASRIHIGPLACWLDGYGGPVAG